MSITSAKVDTDLLKVALREIEAGRKYELDVETVPPLKVQQHSRQDHAGDRT